MSSKYVALRALKRARRALNEAAAAANSALSAVYNSQDKSGLVEPEGAVVGYYVGQTYSYLDGAGAVITTYTFQGTPGQNTGWQGVV